MRKAKVKERYAKGIGRTFSMKVPVSSMVVGKWYKGTKAYHDNPVLTLEKNIDKRKGLIEKYRKRIKTLRQRNKNARKIIRSLKKKGDTYV